LAGVHIISRKRIQEFQLKHPDSASGLMAWYKIMRTSKYTSFNDLRKTFPSADLVDSVTVFNIGGNKYRLIAAVHYNRNKLYIRHILKHADYDKAKWRN